MKKSSRDKYNVSGNVEAQYLDESQTVLVNKKGIADLETLQIEEEEALAAAYEALLSVLRTDTPMTCDLLRYIHLSIFGELYEWAGRWRTVEISKPGAIWPSHRHLDEAMRTFEEEVLRNYPAESLSEDVAFCEALGHIQGEFLAIHPFREGNARTIKLMTNLLSLQTRRPLLLYDQSTEGVNRYIAAAQMALLKKDYGPLTEIIQQALTAARQQS